MILNRCIAIASDFAGLLIFQPVKQLLHDAEAGWNNPGRVAGVNTFVKYIDPQGAGDADREGGLALHW